MIETHVGQVACDGVFTGVTTINVSPNSRIVEFHWMRPGATANRWHYVWLYDGTKNTPNNNTYYFSGCYYYKLIVLSANAEGQLSVSDRYVPSFVERIKSDKIRIAYYTPNAISMSFKLVLEK